MGYLPNPLQAKDNLSSWFSKLRNASQSNVLGGSPDSLTSTGVKGSVSKVNPHSGTANKFDYKYIANIADLFRGDDDYDNYADNLTSFLETALSSSPDLTTVPAADLSGFLEYCGYSDKYVYKWWSSYKKGSLVSVPRNILVGFEGTGDSYDFTKPIWALPGLYIATADIPAILPTAQASIVQDGYTELGDGTKAPEFKVIRDTTILYTPCYPERRIHPDLLEPFFEGGIDATGQAYNYFPQLRFFELVGMGIPTLQEFKICVNGKTKTYLLPAIPKPATDDSATNTDGQSSLDDALQQYFEPLNPWVVYWAHDSITAYCEEKGYPVPDLAHHPGINTIG